jgi:hypothetical protein
MAYLKSQNIKSHANNEILSVYQKISPIKVLLRIHRHVTQFLKILQFKYFFGDYPAVAGQLA